MQAARFGKIPTTSVRLRISLLSRVLGVVAPDLGPVLGRERAEAKQVALGVDEELGGRGELGLQLVDDPVELRVHLGGIGLGEDRAHEGRDDRLGGLRDPGEQVAHGMRATPLPGGAVEDRGDGVLQPLVGVGDDERDPGQPACDETAQERRPAGPVLGAEDVDAEDLPVAIGVHAGRDDRRHA